MQVEQPKVSAPERLMHLAQPLASQRPRAKDKDTRVRLLGEQLMRNRTSLDSFSKAHLVG